ncbi:nucleotide disphospho-sugar-binding domain-containing protein [Streptomyces sp. NPDC004232]|uniref:nucleotide disphospho-sugar-binding domain-containing protein n=1 Tax=Streptomyces sp. NPDC004232 TaxID=3154454 RepID=UPI0033B73123
MRVLFTSWAWASHYMPLAPLVWALQGAGHDVRVASQPALARVITDSGAAAVPVGRDLDHAEVRGRQMAGITSFADVPRVPAAGSSMAAWSPERLRRVRQVFGTFAAYSDAMLDDLAVFARGWRPDLVVYDPTTYAGPIVAAALGVPAVRHVHGIDVTYQAREAIPDLIRDMAGRLGVGEVDVLGDATVDPCPASLQIPADLRRIPIRYVPYNGPAVVPDWLRARPARPRVCVTWGTSTSRIAGPDTFLPTRLVRTLSGMDVDLVMTLSSADTDRLGKVPEQVRVVDSLALHLVLPGCDAIIHQGGNGTILTAACQGVPQFVLPQIPDQIFQAERLVAAGVGDVVTPGDFDEAETAKRIEGVLTGEMYRSRARTLREEMRARPAPAEAVAQLEELVAGRWPPAGQGLKEAD